MDFSTALAAIKAGSRITREGWNATGQWAALQVPDEHSKMQRPYMYLKTANDELVPWVPTQSDLMADDWRLFDPRDARPGGPFVGTVGLPTYRCHKVVSAGKIVKVEPAPNGAVLQCPIPGDPDGESLFISVDANYLRKHGDVKGGMVGGYFVEYEDGYWSWSPAEAFEGGYTLIQ